MEKRNGGNCVTPIRKARYVVPQIKQTAASEKYARKFFRLFIFAKTSRDYCMSSYGIELDGENYYPNDDAEQDNQLSFCNHLYENIMQRLP